MQPLPSGKASRNQVFLAPELQSPVTFQVPLASRKNRGRFILRICASEDHDAGIVQAEARARAWRTETIARKSGTIRQGIENDYDEQRQSINFMIGKSQLSDFTPQSNYERVETRYRVKSLSLTFTVDVWQRDAEQYEGQEVTHSMEDLDVEWQR